MRPAAAVRRLDGGLNRARILFLDSASIPDAEEAASSGCVAGITTNPSLLAQEKRRPFEQMKALLAVFPGLVFYQPASTDPSTALAEIERLVDVAGERLVAKLPALPQLFPLAAQLHGSGVPSAITAVYSGGQALMAAAVGAEWVIPYVNRAKRLMDNGQDLVGELAALLARQPQRPLLLAASLKSSEEALLSIRSGADAVSLPIDVFKELGSHPLTVSAVEQFATDARRS